MATRKKKPASTAETRVAREVKIFYTTGNGGDGSAFVRFHEDTESAGLAVAVDEASGEAFADTLKFNAVGKLLNPTVTKEELRSELRSHRPGR